MADPDLSHLFQRGAATDDWRGFSPPEVWERNCQVFFAYAVQPGDGGVIPLLGSLAFIQKTRRDRPGAS
jgi:hypothetical protein